MSSKWETQDTETDEQTKERRHIVSDTVHKLEELVQNWTAAKLRGNIIFLGNALTDGFVGNPAPVIHVAQCTSPECHDRLDAKPRLSVRPHNLERGRQRPVA